ncbi:translation initiation factor IF-2 [Psychroflexus halocasei]|uniref:Translation initiation factor IF-2 n=1 Tax=Psychroflexus halocasei TaxID=908615 RepID=A0A1H4AK73_9FLAO|nr:translation initiation factor IF-2 [Psychroflexus halocasei]SEA36168.1 translation initiation factor IF-2 [Psychroflexus halocasei]
MAEKKQKRLNKVLKEFNISLDRAVEYLGSEGYEIEARPTTKISHEVYEVLFDKFETDKSKRAASKEASEERKREKEEIRKAREKELLKKKEEEAKRESETKKRQEEALKEKQQKEEKEKKEKEKAAKEEAEAKKKEEEKKKSDSESSKSKLSGPKYVGKIDLEEKGKKPKSKKPKQTSDSKDKPKSESKQKNLESPKASKASEAKETNKDSKAEEKTEEEVKHETQYTKLKGPNFTGQKIDLDKFKKPAKKKDDNKGSKKRKRKRINKPGQPQQNSKFKDKKGAGKGRKKKSVVKEEPTEAEVQKQIRETLEKLQGKSSKGKGSKYRKDKRQQHRQKTQEESDQLEKDSKILKVTEFVTVSEVATMMDVPATKVISACMSLGMMVTMNQRLDAETLSVVAEEFGYEVEFVSAEIEDPIEEVEVDDPSKMVDRAPIVTVMGHVDHGKTSLLDYVRKENVIAGESGGITQHIGAYGVELDNGQKIAFLDTPGHEAFTAMRARGAQVTDVAIIVIAADDDVMPQTKEAISHAQAAGVPIVFAINKVDLPTANVEKVKESLANMNLLVEDWGGKVQSQDISAKKGTGVKELLEKVLLEAEILELKANPDRNAKGTVVEAYLDKGRGYVSTILVQSGTLKVGDYVLAGTTSGKIKALHDERGNKVNEAGPSTPVSILGLDGAPQAGDTFQVMNDEREAKDIASKRTQLQREQSVRTQKHVTLDEIGRRIALGDFKELNIILKADVDGSVEALTDSLQKLSTEEIQVNIIHKGVGAITESDVLLASASDAVIIGFNVRPAGNARTLADKEEIDIRSYSIIYDAINDIKDAMEGMLSPELKEEITGTAEVRETFKISKIGTIAGCMVTSGKIYRNSGIRLIRDGIVIYTGTLASLKRFKDDVKEVSKGYDCGIQIKNYNDLKNDDIIEAYQEVEVKKKLK